MKRLLIFFALAVVILANPLSMAQTDPSATAIDESAVIFAGCRLSKLNDPNAKGTIPIKETPADVEAEAKAQGLRKQEYVKGCITEIIRFIIVIASLAAILKIAASGIQGMYQDQSKQIRGTVTNTVIGLFLLIVGWNLIPILNNSFNNVDFLNLPAVNYCDVKGGCIPKDIARKQRFQGCTERYEEIMDDKLYDTTQANRDILITCIIEFCNGPINEKNGDNTRKFPFGDDACEDIKGIKDRKVISKKIDAYNIEGIELRKSKGGGDNTPSADLEVEVIRLVNAGKINQIEGQKQKIIEQVQKKQLKKVTLRFLASLAKAPGVESIKIWEPFRPESPPRFHGKGMAVDLKSVTMGGKEYTADDAFAGKDSDQFKKIAEIIYGFKTTRQIIMAGPIVDKLRALPNFSAPARRGTIEKIRISTTGGPDKTQRHEDHWHVDMFE
jgi:hypothetical protein